MKNLENYGVQELDTKEEQNINGGDCGFGIVVGLIGLAIYLYDNRDQIAAGFAEGYIASQQDGFLDN